jgi:hypothetical protein
MRVVFLEATLCSGNLVEGFYVALPARNIRPLLAGQMSVFAGSAFRRFINETTELFKSYSDCALTSCELNLHLYHLLS